MTIWIPDIAPFGGPRYKAIADALAADVADGTLEAGAKLPTHRDLAYRLGLNVGTVSRAYAEAERRGLVSGTVGRGTFVRDPGRSRSGSATPRARNSVSAIAHDSSDDLIDMAPAFLPPGPRAEALSDTLRAIADAPDATVLLDYETQGGLPRHRTVLSDWISGEIDAPVNPDGLTLANGGQHAIVASILAVTSPGDIVAAEALTYPPVKAMAEMLGRRLVGVAIDEDGMIPEALDTLCRRAQPRALYLTPTMQNPTTATLPDSRRAAILEIAQRHGITVIADDIYGYLSDIAATPLVAMAPERVLHIGGLSKSAAPGLRVGWIVSPPSLTDAVRTAVRSTTWSAAPLAVEVGCRWAEDGTLARLRDWHAGEARRRQRIARDILGLPLDCDAANAYFIWLKAGDTCRGAQQWRSADLVARLAAQNVRVVPDDAFSVPGYDGTILAPESAIRIGIGTPKTDAALTRGLETIAATIDNPSICQMTVV